MASSMFSFLECIRPWNPELAIYSQNKTLLPSFLIFEKSPKNLKYKIQLENVKPQLLQAQLQKQLQQSSDCPGSIRPLLLGEQQVLNMMEMVDSNCHQVIMITESIRNNFESRFGDSSSLGGKITQVHHILWPHFIFPVMNILLTSRSHFVHISFPHKSIQNPFMIVRRC